MNWRDLGSLESSSQLSKGISASLRAYRQPTNDLSQF
jgi:hypothetical protein